MLLNLYIILKFFIFYPFTYRKNKVIVKLTRSTVARVII